MISKDFIMPEFNVEPMFDDFAISVNGDFSSKQTSEIQEAISTELNLCRENQSI